MPCILNAANEMAVNAFLAEKISFLQMSDVVIYTMEHCTYSLSPDLDFLKITDLRAREIAINYINKLHK